MKFENTKDFAETLDQEDTLKHHRGRFHLPKNPSNQELIYFCGNSLGPQPKSVRSSIDEVLDSWENNAVDGHFSGSHPWFAYHEFLTGKLARIVGALPSEVVAMNSLTVNLHLMMVSFYRPTSGRYKILVEQQAFPSDQYAVESQIKFHGLEPRNALMEVCPRDSEFTLRSEDLLELIDREGNQIALILLPGVQYYTGQAFDFAEITDAAHKKGCKVGFDLAHAAGNLVLKLHDWGVDFAVWCSYKYLNAGPGAVGGCFVHERYGERSDIPRFAGWWGHDINTRFQMPQQFSGIIGVEGWQLSNPPILSMAPLLASLEIFDDAGMEELRTKSEILSGFLEFLLLDTCADQVSIITPRRAQERGSQLSLTLRNRGEQIRKKLIDAGIICDWREPDVMRVSPAPLYNRFSEVFDFVKILHSIL